MEVVKLFAEGSVNSKVNDGLQKVNPGGVNTDLYTMIQNILNWIFGVIGIVAVIMIIIGGFNMMISSGDPGKVKKGKDTILYGIIGLVVAILAFAIVNFVLTNVFK